MLVDVHCHLERESIVGRIDSVIESARAARLGMIITAGVTPDTNDAALALARKYPDIVRPSFGMYPLDALGIDVDEGNIVRKAHPFDVGAELERWKSMKNDFVAVGEVGLDLHWEKSPELFKKQQDVFAQVLEVAEAMNKPVIIHSRDAERECVEMLETTGLKAVVMHCFSGRKSLVRRCVDAGFLFSIPANVSRSQQFQILAEMSPLDHLLTETDAPWLAPTPGETNEPKNVASAIPVIARIKKVDESLAEEMIWGTASRLFNPGNL